MTLTPFYTGQGGGRFSWQCVGKADYSNQLASITGLQRSLDFSGGIAAPKVTIVIAGGGLTGGDTIGDALTIGLAESGTGQSVTFGHYIIRNIETVGNSATITAEGSSSAAIIGDYNHFKVPASEPRALAVEWLQAADQSASLSGLTAPAYTETSTALGFNNWRHLSRVAAPAATLAGLAGFANATSITGCRWGDEQSSTTWTQPITYSSEPLALTIDAQWDACPGYDGQRYFTGRYPLYWHQAGQYWHITWTGRVKWPSVSSDRSQWPLGVTEYLALEIKTQGGALYNVTTRLSPSDYLNPDNTEDIEVTFKSRKEAKEFYRANAAYIPPGGPKGWGWSGYGNTESDIKRWGGSKTVKITGVATYAGQRTGWYLDSRAAIAPTAPSKNSIPATDVIEFGQRTMYTASGSLFYNLQYQLANITPQYLPQRFDSLWRQAGVTSYANLHPGYEIYQDAYPITIAQEYTTRAHAEQACALGSMGLYDSDTTISAVDTCPESGQVFGLALTVNTVAEVSPGSSYPLPCSWQLKFKGPHNDDHTYNYTDQRGSGEPATLEICQASLMASARPIVSGASATYSLDSITWAGNVGGLIDRWTGSNYTPGGVVTFSSWTTGPGADAGAYLLGPDGQVYERYFATLTSYSGASNYAVRGQDGTEHKLFCQGGYMEMSTWPEAGTYSEPLLDIYPLSSFLKAHARVFADNYNRDSYRVKGTIAFASCAPGDVLAVNLPQINGGAKTLAFVVSTSVSTDQPPELEIVPMHTIAASDYSVWSNLEAVLK